MKTVYIRAAALFTTLLLALTACSGGPDTGTAGSNRGRYVEQAVDVDGDLFGITGISQLADGSYRMLAFLADERSGRSASGTYHVLGSEDGGRTWQDRTPGWLEHALDGMDAYYSDAAFLSDNDWYLLASLSSESGYEYRVYHSDGKGLTQLDYELRDSLGKDNSGFYSIEVVGDNLLFQVDYNAYLANAQTGRKLATFPVDNVARWGSYSAWGDSLVIGQRNRIDLFDLGSGDLRTELPLSQMPAALGKEGFSNNPDDLTVMTFQEDGEALYYCNTSGLYRMLADGSVTERLMDSALTSLGLPAIYLQYLFRNGDGSFLAVCAEQDAGQRLFLYSFDPDVPTEPDKELKIYSLAENKTIRQAIGSFQLINADVKADYTVGMTGEDSITAADALRALNTELLAGKGPDILVLDGMPVESYMEKGILADLTPVVDERVASGELIAPVANAYRSKDGLFAVAARYAVPLVHGRDIGSVRDVETLFTWLESRGQQLDYDASVYIEQNYTLFAQNWFAGDGSLDIGRFTADMGRIAGILADQDEAFYRSVETVSSGALQLMGGMLPINVGWVNTFTEIAAPYSEIAESGTGEVHLFPREGLFLPRTVLGINSGSGRRELAERFLGHALSAEVLEHDFQDGLPANTAALRTNSENNGTEIVGTWGFTKFLGDDEYENILLHVNMPDEATVEQWLAALQAIETPVFENAVVKAMIIEETAAYFAGDRQLDDTVQALAAKLDLYRKE